jgi:pyruvate dehydrogenase E1 component beta subunit
MTQAIRDDDPVIFFEHNTMFDDKEEVPDEPYTIPFGQARTVREGKDVTIVAIGMMVGRAKAAADAMAKDGIECTLLDPRTTSPLDEEAIIASVKKTGRLIVVDEASPRCGMASDISAIVAEHAFDALKAPIKRVTPPHAPVPFAPNLEKAYLPSVDGIQAAIRAVMGVK